MGFPRAVGQCKRRSLPGTSRDFKPEVFPTRDPGGERQTKQGGMGRPHHPRTRAARPTGRGASPALLLPATIQAGPGPAGLGACTPPRASDSLPRTPRPRRIGGGGASSGPGRPSKLLASSLLHLPPQLRSASLGQEGPCPPRPLPPRLHKVAGRRPPARPERRGPRGSPAGELHRSGHAPGTQGCTGCGWVAVPCTLSCSSLYPHPSPPPVSGTHRMGSAALAFPGPPVHP